MRGELPDNWNRIEQQWFDVPEGIEIPDTIPMMEEWECDKEDCDDSVWLETGISLPDPLLCVSCANKKKWGRE